MNLIKFIQLPCDKHCEGRQKRNSKLSAKYPRYLISKLSKNIVMKSTLCKKISVVLGFVKTYFLKLYELFVGQCIESLTCGFLE